MHLCLSGEIASGGVIFRLKIRADFFSKPELERIEKDKRPTGALSTKRCALEAIEKIKRRESK